MLAGMLRSLRPAQWVKNAFVLAPLVFARRLGDIDSLHRALLAFLLFCAASSAVYLLNDLRDREEDSNHPVKRHRPIAAGIVPAWFAVLGFLVLAAVALVGAWWLGTRFFVLTVIYVALNLLYSFGLKRLVILDVMTVAIGFVVRVMAGGAAIDVKVSSWLLLCTTFVALFLAFSKRRHELDQAAEGAVDQRQVLSQYSASFLDQMINVVTASTVVAYSLYAISPSGAGGADASHMIYTVPLVLFGIFRYLYLVYQRPDHKSPTEALLTDGPFLVNLALWGAVVLWAFYVG
jgi:4-hydroxybenzoate polyprenyltransferase